MTVTKCSVHGCHVTEGLENYEYPYPLIGVEPGPHPYCPEHLEQMKTLAQNSKEIRIKLGEDGEQ